MNGKYFVFQFIMVYSVEIIDDGCARYCQPIYFALQTTFVGEKKNKNLIVATALQMSRLIFETGFCKAIFF